MATSLGRRTRSSTFGSTESTTASTAITTDSTHLLMRPRKRPRPERKPKLSYLDQLPDDVLQQVVRHCVYAGTPRPAPHATTPYKPGLGLQIARTALTLVRCASVRLSDIARREFRVLKETESMPIHGEGLQLCTKTPADYAALERLLKAIEVHRLVLEVREVPRRYTKLVRRAMPNVRVLSMHFDGANRGHELERILAVTVPLDTFEADFEQTDRSTVVALVRHVKGVKQLRLTFAGNGTIKNNVTLMPVWISAAESLREVELMSIWGDRFDAVDTLVRHCRMASITVNGQLIRP